MQNYNDSGFKLAKSKYFPVSKTCVSMEEKLHDIVFGNDFLDMTTKAEATKTKLDKWDSTELKNLSTTKETISRVKRQPTR